jgi:hypothetical protein
MKSLNLPVHCTADLFRSWSALAGPWGFDEPQLFVLVYDADGRPLPLVSGVKELDPWPDPEMIGALCEAMRHLIEVEAPGGSLAIMYARPGRRPAREDDDAWCRALHHGLQKAPFRSWPVFFATDEQVTQVPPDLLVA